MLHALWLPEITIRQGQVHLSEHQRWYYHDGRGGQNRLVFRKGRFVIRRAGECLEEPSRVGDDQATQSSRSRNSSDSSPSFVSVDSNSNVEGGRRPVSYRE